MQMCLSLKVTFTILHSAIIVLVNILLFHTSILCIQKYIIELVHYDRAYYAVPTFHICNKFVETIIKQNYSLKFNGY